MSEIRAPAAGRSRFVRDDPIRDLATKDLFGHHAYTEALTKAVLEASPPFTIGVFGSWGVGKTTITKDYLKSALTRVAPGEVAYAYFDAWKYDGDSLRRQFLRELAMQLKEGRVLKRGYEPEKELEDLRSDVREAIDDGISISGKRLVVAAVRGVIAFALVFAALQLSDSFKDASTSDQFTVALLAAFVTALSTELRGAIVVGQRDLVRKSLDSPELFEDKFRGLMNAVKPKRVVIVVDNLDRCSPDRVIEILGTIKTFLEPSRASRQPIFVIPCDQDAIRRHLEKRSEIDPKDAEEFLRKFFNATLRVNPFLEEEIRDYVEGELAVLELGADLGPENTRELVQLITVAFRANPRRVKQFLNTLSAKLLLIREREAEDAIVPPISGEVPFVAKLTVIEEEFPDFYDMVVQDAHAIESLSQTAIGTQTSVPSHLVMFSNDARLCAFLRATRRIASENVRAFTRLRLTAVERTIPEYFALRNNLVDGQIADVAAILEGIKQEDVDAYADAALGILQEELQNQYFETALNVVDAFVRVPALRESPSAQEVVERLFVLSDLQDLLPTLAPDDTLRLLGAVGTDASRKLIHRYLDLLAQPDLGAAITADVRPQWNAQVANGLAAIRDRLTDDHKTRVRELTASEPLIEQAAVLSALGESSASAEDFLGTEAFGATARRLTREGLALDDQGGLVPADETQLLVHARGVAHDAGINEFAERGIQLLAEVPPDPLHTGLEGLLLLLQEFRSELEGVAQDGADRLVEQLIAVHGVTPAHRRWIVCVLCDRLYARLTEGFQNQASSLVGQLVLDDPIHDLSAYVEDAIARGGEPFPTPVLRVAIDKFGERFRTAGEDEVAVSIAGLFVRNVSSLGRDCLASLLSQAIETRNMRALTAAIGGQRSALEKDARQVLDSTIEHLVVVFPDYPADEQPAVFDLLEMLASRVKAEQRERLQGHIRDLACSEDHRSRVAALEVARPGRLPALLADDDRRSLAEHVTLWLVSRGGSIGNGDAPSFDLLSEQIPVLPASLIEDIVGLLMDVIHRDPLLAAFAAPYLTRFPLDDRRDEVLLRLVESAKAQHDVAQRHAVVRHAHEIAASDRRKRGAKALKTYLEQMRNDPEDAAISSELLW